MADNLKENEMTQNSGSEKETVLFIEDYDNFRKLMALYRCAIMEVETKLRVLNEEFSLENEDNPFISIESRLKSPESIMEKLKKNKWPLTVESIEKNLHDVAGVRVVCAFQSDIFKCVRMLTSQDDVSLIQFKNYIKNPKPNGYRSFHVIIGIPIYLSSERRLMEVEVQFRTVAMDFWASLEHKMRYKKDIKNPEEISQRLLMCAQLINEIDEEMVFIRNMIEK